jgi:carboxypeptidase C (cathepsin A)
MYVQSLSFANEISSNITKFICNWFGGEAVSLAVNYTHSAQFKAAGYAPFHVDGVEYGEVREYGNFSFVRIYEAGHSVPYFQRESPGC